MVSLYNRVDALIGVVERVHQVWSVEYDYSSSLFFHPVNEL